jgi:hypothetical protein
MKAVWEGQPTDPAHLDRLASQLRSGGARVARDAQPSSGLLRQTLGSTAQFFGAYLVKEGIKAVESGDVEGMKRALAQVKRPEFWGSTALFSLTAGVTERLVSRLPLTGAAKGIGRVALPLVAGISVLQLLSGNTSLKDILVSTGAYLAAGAAVSLLADGLVYPALFAAGPPGWVAAAAYSVGKLAVSLYAGEKLEHWLQGIFSKKETGKKSIKGETPRDGVKQAVDNIQVGGN